MNKQNQWLFETPPISRTTSGKNQSNIYPWTNKVLSITIARTNNSQCVGTASPGYSLLMSTTNGCIVTCGGTLMERFKIFFHVDADNQPRPQPFKPPVVNMLIEVITAQGRSKFFQQKSDSKPIYQGAGNPLKTSFGQDLMVSLAPGDTLRVKLQMNDPSSGIAFDYSDNINVMAIPCI
jgi:hypothetical protein